MKFDYIVGNPPYQDETVGDQKTFAPPIYDKFIDESYKIADRVLLIHPARFLFNAGSTAKVWNQKMLSDPHLKVVWHEQDSSKVFPNTDIKGGVAVTYRNANEMCGPIGVFTGFPELNRILHRVIRFPNFVSFSDIVTSRTAYRLTDKMHSEHPEAAKMLSNGHLYDMSTNIFELLQHLFYSEKPKDGHEYIQILGRSGNQRVHKFIRRDYVNNVKNLDKYKVFVPNSNGSGAFGEVVTTPLIGKPLIGHTETFLSIGCFNNYGEAEACLKYIKSKFARTMLDVLKVTQHNPPDTWRYVPLQNFNPASDIDWSKPIPEIDRQLYEKYGLSDNEVEFIETHVKEMN